MADDETVLTSFLTEDESLVDTWDVRGVGEGTSRVPPALDSGELLAITDRRLLWFDGQLFDVALTDGTDVEYRDYTHTTTPTIVSVAWVLFFLSVLATGGAFLFLDVDSFTASLPVTTGLGIVLLAIVVARARGESGEEVDLHRLVVEHGDDVATIWCESDPLEGLQAALDVGEADGEPADDVESTDGVTGDHVANEGGDPEESPDTVDTAGGGDRNDGPIEAEDDAATADPASDEGSN